MEEQMGKRLLRAAAVLFLLLLVEVVAGQDFKRGMAEEYGEVDSPVKPEGSEEPGQGGNMSVQDETVQDVAGAGKIGQTGNDGGDTEDGLICGDYRYEIVHGENTVRILAYLGDEEIVFVPEKLNGMEVSVIGSGAFAGQSVMEEVLLPTGVTKIEKEAFIRYDINPPALLDKNVEYEEVILPDTLVKLGQCCFNHTHIGKMRIPEGVKEIPIGAFYGYSLTEIMLPQGLERIGEYAFGGTLLTEIQLPDTLRLIEIYAFSDVESIEKITIPASVRYIENYAFAYCGSLSEIVFEEGIMVLDADAYLAGRMNLERLQFPESTRFILSGVHSYPYFLERMYIPGGASYIEEGLILNDFRKRDLSVVIYGQEGSRAQELAEEFGMEFVAVESGDEMP